MRTQLLIHRLQYLVTPEKQFSALSAERKNEFMHWNETIMGTVKALCWAAVAFSPIYIM